jgi:hypothetical protein
VIGFLLCFAPWLHPQVYHAVLCKSVPDSLLVLPWCKVVTGLRPGHRGLTCSICMFVCTFSVAVGAMLCTFCCVHDVRVHYVREQYSCNVPPAGVAMCVSHVCK